MTTLKTATRMEGVSIPVSDLERSVAFYTRLGFTVEQRDPSGKGFALLRTEGGTIGLQRRKAEADRTFRDGLHIELHTDDIDGLYAELQAQGIEVETPPRDLPWERVMVLRDPDGFRVEYAQGVRGQNRPA